MLTKLKNSENNIFILTISIRIYSWSDILKESNINSDQSHRSIRRSIFPNRIRQLNPCHSNLFLERYFKRIRVIAQFVDQFFQIIFIRWILATRIYSWSDILKESNINSDQSHYSIRRSIFPNRIHQLNSCHSNLFLLERYFKRIITRRLSSEVQME